MAWQESQEDQQETRQFHAAEKQAATAATALQTTMRFHRQCRAKEISRGVGLGRPPSASAASSCSAVTAAAGWGVYFCAM